VAPSVRLVVALYDSASSSSGRSGVASALRAVAPHLQHSEASLVLDFLLAKGLADPAADVRADMVAAGTSAIAVTGSRMSTRS
jgi:hypothetical protein